MDSAHKLVDKDGKMIALGTRVVDFRGESWTVTDWEAPRHEGSTGRIYVRRDGVEQGFFPSVFGARIVESSFRDGA